jgi:hypothetical protein
MSEHLNLFDIIQALQKWYVAYNTTPLRVLMQSRLAGYARTPVLKVSVDTINGQQVIILEDGDNGEAQARPE